MRSIKTFEGLSNWLGIIKKGENSLMLDRYLATLI